MSFLDSLEKRAPWLAFPQIFRIFVMLHGVFFALLLIRPDSAETLAFNYGKIVNGEFWRLISHFLIPPLTPGSPLTILFLFFYIMIGMMLSDGLEGNFSSFRFSLFIYAMVLSQTLAFLLAGWLVAPDVSFTQGGFFLYEAAFVAFAVIYPTYTIHLFGVIPVPMWLLGAIPVLQALFLIIKIPVAIIFLAIGFAPLLVWAVPRLIQVVKGNVDAASHRTAFQRKVSTNAQTSLHECHICGVTEKDDDNIEFRVAADGEEYCTEHLPPKPDDA